MQGFLHLKVHSDRSILRGMIKPKRLVEWCVEYNVPAAAVTDHGNISAAVELTKACADAAVKPIYGMELNVVADKTDKKQGSQQFVVLATNKAGFNNLIKLATLGAMYFYYIPRVDYGDLKKYADGLILFPSGLNNPLAQTFFARKLPGLEEEYKKVADHYGSNFYLEVSSGRNQLQRAYNDAVIELSVKVGCGVLVACDVFYVNEIDRELHKKVMQIKQINNDRWEYPFKGSNHLLMLDEVISDLTELHGYDVSVVPEFKAALDMPWSIVDRIESFPLGGEKKIPSPR